MTCHGHSCRTLSWIAWSLLQVAQVVQSQEVNTCGHPPVPGGASYVNVTGGLGQRSWVVRYICDTGMENNKCPDKYLTMTEVIQGLKVT